MINIIETIEAQLQKQKDDIFFKEMVIKDLKEQLAAANKELEEMKAKNKALEAANIPRGTTDPALFEKR